MLFRVLTQKEKKQMDKKFKLGVIGCGNMATAILKGIISKQILSKSDIYISDCSIQKLSDLAMEGFNTTITNSEVIENSEVLLLSTKPQNFRESLTRDLFNCSCEFVISIMAGVTLNELYNVFGHKHIVRIMPNLPAMVGSGASALCFFENDTVYKPFVNSIFSSIGVTVELPESKFDVVTSVSGSGPAYVFYFINSMIQGGIDGGLSYEVAKLLAVQTVIGSAVMAGNSEDSLEQLIKNVCSKGGTTIEAIEHFKAENMENIIVDGIIKCRERSAELSKYEKN